VKTETRNQKSEVRSQKSATGTRLKRALAALKHDRKLLARMLDVFDALIGEDMDAAEIWLTAAEEQTAELERQLRLA